MYLCCKTCCFHSLLDFTLGILQIIRTHYRSAMCLKTHSLSWCARDCCGSFGFHFTFAPASRLDQRKMKSSNREPHHGSPHIFLSCTRKRTEFNSFHCESHVHWIVVEKNKIKIIKTRTNLWAFKFLFFLKAALFHATLFLGSKRKWMKKFNRIFYFYLTSIWIGKLDSATLIFNQMFFHFCFLFYFAWFTFANLFRITFCGAT